MSHRRDRRSSSRLPHSARAGWWRRFASRYGWRAYALPALTVITVSALVHVNTATGHGANQRSQVSEPRSAASSGTGAAQRGVGFEGLTNGDAGFRAGATPSPVVITLGSDLTSCATNTYPQLILVSIRKQRLWACDGSKQVNSSPVTTGATIDHDQTPVGSWRVQAKQRDRYLVGPGYRDYVKYWLPFDGDFGLHDASWQTMPFGASGWRTRGSHGCVHTPTATMAWIYRWATVGKTVVTVEG